MRLDTLRTKNDSRRPAPLPGIAAALLALLVPVGLIACESFPLAPRPGLPEYRELATMPIAGPARVDLAGGNLAVSRTDLELDTQLGTFSVGAVWNSAARRWVWSFDDISFANGSFTDATGATYFVTPLAPESAIPGTIWMKQSQYGQSGPNRIRTKGGLEYTFTTSGRPLAIRWASSANPRLEFTQSLQGDGARHTSSIRQCVGSPVACHPVFTIHYDGAGRVREIVDRAGRRARFSYDDAGRLATARDGLDVATDRPGARYEYTGGDLTAVTNSEGERVEYAYDAARRLVRVTQIGAGNPTRTFEYRGRKGSTPYRTIAIDPLGAVAVYRYDAEHQLLAVEQDDVEEETTFTWNARRVTSRTLPSGVATYWAYADDDVIARFEPSGNITSYSYRADGVDRADPRRRPLLRKSDLLGTIEERSYDADGRLTSVANGAGDTLRLEYGADQMVSAFTDPAGIQTVLSDYGEHGHPGSVRRAERTETFVYDAVGNLTAGPSLAGATGPGLGGIASRRFDEDRNVAVVTLTGLDVLPLAAETVTTVFRSDRRPLLVARPGGGDDVFVYDALGRLVRQRERADGAWRDTTLTYDAVGRVAAIDRANGMGRRWTYDPIGRVKTVAVVKGSLTENFAAFAWSDGLVRLFFDSRSGTEVYSYDGAGRLEVVDYGNGDRAVLSSDLRSRRTGVVLQESGASLLRTIAVAHDAAGRERSVYDNGVPVIERTWVAGRLGRTVYGNGLVRNYLFDPDLGALAGMEMTAESFAVETSSVEIADPDCIALESRCVTARTTSDGSLAATSAERHHMMPVVAPHGLERPGERVGYQDGAGAAFAEVYGYDALSNLRSGPAGNFAYNQEANRLHEIAPAGGSPAVTYEYDAAGFATSRSSVPIVWDGAGRISSYGDATFTWDALGRPVSSTVDGVAVKRRFGGLVESDAMGQPTAIDLGEVRIDLAGNDTRFRHFDYRGNVKLVTDEAGEVIRHYEYSSYGVRRIVGVDEDTTSFARGRLVGDLVRIGHRLYDPIAARFLAPDPIHQLLNQYAYTLGNPVQLWDPSGAQAVTNDQAAGAMMQAAGNSLTTIGGAVLVAGIGSLVVPVPGLNVFTSAALIGVGANFIVLGEGLKSIGGLLGGSGGGSGGFGGGFGAGPGISAPGSFNDHVGPTPDPGGCGGDACVGEAAIGGLGQLGALAGLSGPASPGGGGGGGGCAPVALGDGRLPDGALAWLFVANVVTGAIVWRRARTARSAVNDV